jgi:hypothetical protein
LESDGAEVLATEARARDDSVRMNVRSVATDWTTVGVGVVDAEMLSEVEADTDTEAPEPLGNGGAEEETGCELTGCELTG